MITTSKRKSTTKYSNTKVTTSNLLTNVSYRRYKPFDVEKTNFVFGVFSLLTQNLNTKGPDRKLEAQLERDYVKTICDACVPHKFKRFIYARDNFIKLCQPYITYQKANNIVLKFIEEDTQNVNLLKASLRHHLKTIQYVHYLFFPKIYNRTNKFRINNKSHFDFIFNNWKPKIFTTTTLLPPKRTE